MVYETEFRCTIRRHNVYKIAWFLVINEKFDCKKKRPRKSSKHDKRALGRFLKNGTLVSHIPIELSNLIYFFLESATENFLSAFAVVPRKHEVGLAVPAKFTAATKKLRVATVL